MKKQLLILFLMLWFILPSVHAQTTAIPDASFEDYLETHTADGLLVNVGDANSMGDGIANNGLVLNNNITNVITLNISSLGVSDLTGIAGFVNLEALICSANSLETIDVSQNLNLKSLLCGSNLLTSIDFSNNLNLETVNCSNNQIQNLNLVNAGTQLAFNPLLKSLSCSGNQLTNIDVSKNDQLILLNLSNNRFTGQLDFTNNVLLENLFFASNKVTGSDLSLNTVLQNIDVSNNQLATLNISNGSNASILTFNSEDNPSLVCIQIDNGFTPPTTEPLTWVKDAWSYFSSNACADAYTYVPDDNFEQELITLGYDTGTLDNFVLTASINAVPTLNVSGKNISDLTGIEDFTALTDLDCSNNDITLLDVSNNTNLTSIDCSNNILPSLDLSANTLLENLNCSSQKEYIDPDDATKNYKFNTINIQSNGALLALNCSDNALVSLDISGNVLLNTLDCSLNQIMRLDTSSNTVLTLLNCSDNNLSELKLKNIDFTLLADFDARNNMDLYCIEVDDVATANAKPTNEWFKDGIATYVLSCGTYVPDDNFEDALIARGYDTAPRDNYVPTANIIGETILDVNGENISDLTGIEGFAGLLDLNCSNNTLTNLDLSSNVNLTDLNCASNQIENLDLSLNPALVNVSCNDNNLFTLNIKNGAIASLNLFDATLNANLYCIEVDDEAIANAKPITDWQKDNIATYSVNCAARFVTILDDNFEQALIDYGYDSGPLDDRVLLSNIEHLLSLDVSDRNIASLDGIKNFASLNELDCSGNSLSELDVSDMTNLVSLNCNSNYLETNSAINGNGVLNISGTSGLVKLFCASNALVNLDVSSNSNLEELDCADNNIGIINVLGNVQLKTLNSTNNNLTVLDISQNTQLEALYCDNNQITSITPVAVANSTLKEISCSNNKLKTFLINNYLALERLNCRNNDLEQLVLTSNTALKTLDFTSNAIKDIDFTNNINLVSILASQNNLTQLNLTTNNLLEILNCDSNQINSLIINSAITLTNLTCSNNQLTSLDVSNNSNLVELYANSNSIVDLTLGGNLSDLKILNCSNNQIIGGIDLSSMGTTICPPVINQNTQDYCPDTVTIDLSSNQLGFVNLQNGINGDISNFNAINNPTLKCIQVDDVNNIGATWLKDVATEYSLDCRFGETYVPDDNFELALITLGYDALPLDDYVPTNAINALIALDISGENISDLTGIEDFIALQNLNCSNNALSGFNISKNINLTEINCSNNTLSTIDFGSNVALITINCSGNSTLSQLDLVNNINLVNLNISNNAFSQFDSSLITTLSVFNCDFNQLVNLDFSSNINLTDLSCASNVLETLSIKNGQNINLNNLNAQNNIDLTCIVTDSGNVPNGVIWLKDSTAEYEIECHYGETYVPDDGFEQALITKGLDSGILDDYVLTSNIDNTINLDISNNAIEDLTGLEAFISLKNLSFSNNNVPGVDLSKNIFLETLDASNNVLNAIDVSSNPNLEVLNISENSFSNVDLSSNTNLLELNVSGNQLTVLNIDALVKLQELDCSSNGLESLSVVLNPQLISLYCQSNRFISDQLNLQNGANPNLINFNATDNVDLKCILVDDPFTILTNTGGVYDNWFKDSTSNYQSVCIDADNDGVNNADDLCPNSVFGQPVDLFGCEYLNLPNNNFTVLITGETCLHSNNGKINITANEVFNFTATVTSDDFDEPFSTEYKFTNDVEIRNLLAGTYQMCITIEEWPDYINCYDVVINHPEELAVLTNKRTEEKKVALELSGSSSYNIDLNGLTFTTNSNEVTLNLQEGNNYIKVATDLECQGVYEEHIFLSNELMAYPNPFHNKVNVYLGEGESEREVTMHSYLGQLVYSKKIEQKEDNNIEIDTQLLALGFYTISVKSKTSVSTFKLVKK